MSADHLTRHVFSSELLVKSLQAVLDEAKKLKRAGSLIVVDVHGKLVFAYRMQKALPSTYDFAHAKALTAANLGISSHAVAGIYEKTIPIFTGLLTVTEGQNVPFPGGFPITIGPEGQKVLVGGMAFGSTSLSVGEFYDTNAGHDPLISDPTLAADIVCAKRGLAVIQNGLS